MYIEILDSTRVHPETYEWARKMAVDALEYDEVYIVFCFNWQAYQDVSMYMH